MARTCPACGAENRDTAKFCLKCAQQLVSLKPDPENKPQDSSRRRRKRKKSTTAPKTKSQDLFWIILLALALLALGTALWRWAVPPGTATPVKPPAAPAEITLPAPSPVPESETLWQALRELEAQAEQQAAQRAAERAAEHARQEQARRQARSAESAQRSETPVQPRAPERDTCITETVEPLPVVPHPPAAPTLEPAQANTLCPGVGVFARARCLQTECSKPELAQHPDCVRMRELQESLQQSAGGG